MSDDIILCRCSDVSLSEIRDLIDRGYKTFEEMKRILRVGMGPCQGRTCTQLILSEISKATGEDISKIKSHTSRPPVIGIELCKIAKGGEYID